MSNGQQHTPEPWRQYLWNGNTVSRHVYGAGGETIALVMRSNGESDARRIVACVNACAGVSTGDLETAPGYKAAIEGFHEQRAAKLSAEAQRDQLLAALERIAESGKWYASALEFHLDQDGKELEQLVFAAIAAARAE